MYNIGYNYCKEAYSCDELQWQVLICYFFQLHKKQSVSIKPKIDYRSSWIINAITHK